MATTPTALAHRGLTLIEALVVILILAILGLIAYPLLKDIIVQQRGHVITQQLLSTLNLARNTALAFKRRVVVCKSLDGSRCDLTANWASGWIVFFDDDNDGDYDEGELIQSSITWFNSGWTIRANSPLENYVSYTGNGRSRMANGAFQAGTFTLCHPEYPSLSRQLVINHQGRARLVVPNSVGC